MKDFWKVTSNVIDGHKAYSVYRNIRPWECDHSGNQEYACGWLPTREEASELARRLNQEGAHER